MVIFGRIQTVRLEEVAYLFPAKRLLSVVSCRIDGASAHDTLIHNPSTAAILFPLLYLSDVVASLMGYASSASNILRTIYRTDVNNHSLTTSATTATGLKIGEYIPDALDGSL